MFVIVDTAKQKALRVTNRDEVEAGVLQPGTEQHVLPDDAASPENGPVKWDPDLKTLVPRDVSTRYVVVDAKTQKPIYVTDEDHAAEGRLPEGAEQRALPADAPDAGPRKLSADGKTLVVDELAVWQQKVAKLEARITDAVLARTPLVDAANTDAVIADALESRIDAFDQTLADLQAEYKALLQVKPV